MFKRSSSKVVLIVGCPSNTRIRQQFIIIIIIMYISWFTRSTNKARSRFYKDDSREMQITEIKMERGMSETLSYWRSTLEGELRCRKAMEKAQVCQWKQKLENYFSRTKQSFLGLFVSNRLPVIFCLRAPNLRMAGAKHGRSWTTEIEIWSESPDVNSVA